MPRNIQRPKMFVSKKMLAEVKRQIQDHEHRLATDPDYARRYQEASDECMVGMKQLAAEAEKRRRNSEISFELRHTPIGPRHLI